MDKNFNSATYWEKRYKTGKDSGIGSRDAVAQFKANTINDFVKAHEIRTVVDLGCGDGNQLRNFQILSYIGFDISPSAIKLCKEKFKDDSSKKFFIYDHKVFIEEHKKLKAELALSLDVLYHLVEDEVYQDYLKRLFTLAEKFVIIYSTLKEGKGYHICHRLFIKDVYKLFPEWTLIRILKNRFTTVSGADFYFYERKH